MEKKQLFSELNTFIKEIGFKKQGIFWSKKCDEYVLVAHLRKSQ